MSKEHEHGFIMFRKVSSRVPQKLEKETLRMIGAYVAQECEKVAENMHQSHVEDQERQSL